MLAQLQLTTSYQTETRRMLAIQRNLGWSLAIGLALALIVSFPQETQSTDGVSPPEAIGAPRVEIPFEPSPLPPPSEHELLELAEIRRQVQGSSPVRTLFTPDIGDVEFDAATNETYDSQFLSVLRSLDNAKPTEVPGGDARCRCEFVSSDLPADEAVAAEVSPTVSAVPCAAGQCPADLPLTELLLVASQRLDEKVHQMDRRSEYDEADRLRELANRLRAEVRSLR